MFARLYRYGPANSHDIIKALALVIMTIDHVGAYVMVDELWWRAIGRVTFPVWFFLIGYARGTQISTALWAYALLLIGVNVATGHALFPLNALVSIIMCRLALNLCERHDWVRRYPVEIIAACCLGYLVSMPLFEYGTLAVAFAMFGRMVRYEMHGPRLRVLCAALAAVYIGIQITVYAFTISQCMVVILGTAICCVVLYRFEIRPMHLPRLLNLPVLVCARYSLEYYVLHRALLQAVGLALGISIGHFTWMNL